MILQYGGSLFFLNDRRNKILQTVDNNYQCVGEKMNIEIKCIDLKL